MPLLDFAIAQSSFQNPLGTLIAVGALMRGKCLWNVANENENISASMWKPQRVVHLNPELRRGDLLSIKAVATIEADRSVKTEYGRKGSSHPPLDTKPTPASSEADLEALQEKEKLRRKRISKANKGNTPWNKGRKHSAETLQRIKERTKLAMQDPKVKMKLVNLGHAQTDETRVKIGVGVRIGWQKRREKLLLQELCYFEWKNLVAEASRKGGVGEDEMQWDSYKTLEQQLKLEWSESVEQRKAMPRPKGNKRAPKSLEQRRKISEAIYAKWAEREYRERVCSALAKYHGVPDGTERKSRRTQTDPKDDSARRSPATRKPSDACDSVMGKAVSLNTKPKSKRSNSPRYKDPLVTSKLTMIKNLRAQRTAAEESRKIEAVQRAKLLIAEAEKAAKALEAAAMRNPLAQSSLAEARKLIDEALQAIKSVEVGKSGLCEDTGASTSPVSPSFTSDFMGIAQGPVVNGAHNGNVNVNGVRAIHDDSESLLDALDGKEVLETTSGILEKSLAGKPNGSINGGEEAPQPNGSRYAAIDKPMSTSTTSKGWVRGRLVVEVAEGHH